MANDNEFPEIVQEHIPVSKAKGAHDVESTPLLPSTLPFYAAVQPSDMTRQPRSSPGFIGKYEILKELATGGMGVVYQARDPDLHRIVALKTIRSGALAGPGEVLRFTREAQAVAQLSHANIVQVFEVGLHEGQHYFTMAFAQGGSLATNRTRYDTPWAVAHLVEKLARAVHHAHSRGILHRDLKPGNVLLDEHGEPLISDFGLAKFLEGNLELTQSGKRLGTVPYMAPEQVLGQNDKLAPQTDIWALGVILYELLAGRRPFGGTADHELTGNILASEPASLRKARPRLDRSLEVLALKCLEKDPARRFASAEALADELARWQRGEPIKTRRLPVPLRLWRAIRKHPFLTGMAALAVFGVIFAAAWYFSHPFRGIESMQQELAEGQAKTVIAEQGGPIWMRWAYGTGETRMSPIDNTFTVSAWNRALLELIPAPLPQQYRFSAEVCQRLASGSNGQVGIYFAYKKLAPEASPIDSYCYVAFNDIAVPVANVKRGITKNDLALLLRMTWKGDGKFDADFSRRVGVATTFKPLPETWRRLAVEARPDSFTLFWDGEHVGEPLPRSKLMEETAKLLRMAKLDPANVQPVFAAQDACGLYVSEGTASFRNVAIQPLEP